MIYTCVQFMYKNVLTGYEVLETRWLSHGVSRSQTYTCPPQVCPSKSCSSVGDVNAMMLALDIVTRGRTNSGSVALKIKVLRLQIVFMLLEAEYLKRLKGFLTHFSFDLRPNYLSKCGGSHFKGFRFVE